MRPVCIALLLLATLLGPRVAGAQPRAVAPQLSPAEVSMLAAGDVVVDIVAAGRLLRGRVLAVVDGPLDEVWSIVSDFASQDEWIPDMYDARVLSTSGSEILASAKMRLVFPLRDREYTLRIGYEREGDGDAARCISTWDYVEGNMEANSGYWLLQPWQRSGAQTLVVYEFEAGSGIASPDSLEQRVATRTMPGIMDGLRARHAALY